ncbi:aminotransferase class III-fold pyridoxal phosphate-dependent enzyme [Curtobacterium sp. PhB146]|uniref:aspartate aminotransferase family protein n=1 Tax=Curtobacterium sp. PhB146 TaxID=2485187 RepID=UPI0010E7754D|nr:aminotransferase class III-fold pyridoxal phosphate-dependent enzyme [Curtobacterium sp. PhB146]TCU43759.1 4-aminobutyrate aminotransferase-like enzyme [Curtobacterium sp. PhB146]
MQQIDIPAVPAPAASAVRTGSATNAAVAMVNRFDPADAASLPDGDQQLLARRREVLGDIYPLFYARPIHVVRGEGARLWDADGAEYLDAYNNVPAVGHANPRIATAVYQQLIRMNTHTRYLQDGIVEFAERFLQTYPEHLDRVIFSNSGSEANDLAITIAQWRTGNQGLIVTENAYHGTTQLLAGASPENGATMPLHPWVRTVPAPDTHRDGDRAGELFAAAITEAADDLDRHGFGLAALLLDSIMSTDGIFPGAPGMLVPAYRATHAAGGLVIADEVQPGVGRTGDAMWGFQRHTQTEPPRPAGAEPSLQSGTTAGPGPDGHVDMVTCGKPLAGGLPIGTLVLGSALSDGYAEEHRYFNTFGGNPASIAAAAAVLDEVQDRGLVEHAREVGAYLMRGIAERSASTGLVADVRGAGLFIGVEMAGPGAGELAGRVVNALRSRNVLISAVGSDGRVLKVRPPLVFTREDADAFLDVYDSVLSTLQQEGPLS